MLLGDFLVRYFVGWLSFLLFAAVVASRLFRTHPLPWRDWVSFLGVPWKLVVFVPAVVFVTFAGAFTDDETWDVVTGGGMAVLTWLTSAWSVGITARVLRRQAPWGFLIVALAVALFSSAWLYDGYLLLRDGAYTARWLGNLRLSPWAYVSAGVVLNLEERAGRLQLAWVRPDWPRPASRRVSASMVLLALPFMGIAAWVLIGFVGWRW